MKLIDILRLSFGNLRRNMLRTVLTVSGVVVGIGTIVFLVSFGFGLQELAVSKVANLDALTQMSVTPGKEGTTLDQAAVDKFKQIDGVKAVSPLLRYSATINYSGNSGEAIAYGVTPKYLPLEDITVDYGSKTFSSDSADETIVTVGSLKSLKLTDPEKALGKTVELRIVKIVGTDKKEEIPLKLRIIGISKDSELKSSYIPINLIGKTSSTVFDSIKVKINEKEEMPVIRKAINSLGFPTTSVNDTVSQINQVFVIVQFVLGGFGFIALMVAAIGIFNTLTIALLERTHEIGIMKAIGGRNTDVAFVFTAEASMIGLFGGIIGVSIGWLLGKIVNVFTNYVATTLDGTASTLFSTPWWFATAVVLFAFSVSTIAGIMPARRAAKLDPLEALRYE